MPKPLTRKNADGNVYERLSLIDQDIARWETVDASLVADAARITDHSAKGYIKHEVVLHLLRKAGKSGETRYFYAIFPVFVARMRRLVRQMYAKRPLNLDELVDEVTSAFSEMLAKDAAVVTDDEIDFFEVRFGPALRFFIKRRLEESERWYSIHVSSDRDVDEGEVELPPSTLHEGTEMTEPEKAALRGQIERALDLLSGEERLVIELRFLKGMKINSKNVDEETISKRLGLTERTIRNRLYTAAEKLSKFKERS